MAYFSLCTGSYISRAPVSGMKFTMFFSNSSGITATLLRRAEVAGHHEDAVLVDQLLGREHGLARVVGGVLDQQADLAAVDAALLVDLVDAHLHAGARLLAEARRRAGKVLDRADHDLVLG